MKAVTLGEKRSKEVLLWAYKPNYHFDVSARLGNKGIEIAMKHPGSNETRSVYLWPETKGDPSKRTDIRVRVEIVYDDYLPNECL